MEVKKGKKTLYHIQNMNIGSDGCPFDTFVWCEFYPRKAELKTAFLKEYEGSPLENDKDLLNEFLTSSEVYAVYAEDI